MAKLNFGDVDKLMLFGGGAVFWKVLSVALENKLPVIVYSAERFLKESIDGRKFIYHLRDSGVEYHVSEDINADKSLLRKITGATLGLSVGSPWIFRKTLLSKFNGRLLNLHGTRLPQDRGGGGFSWMIMRGSKAGCCLLHQIDEGVDTGLIVKRREFMYGADCRIPADYFECYINQNIPFLNEFFAELKKRNIFDLMEQEENMSSYWPRLNTQYHGYIDWSWDAEDIESFINAFDDPYPGASSFVNGTQVFLKGCYRVDTNEKFHPFQSGIVFRKNTGSICVAAKGGGLSIKKVFDRKSTCAIGDIRLGDRLYTPVKYLEKARMFKAQYGPLGLKKKHG